MAFIFSFSLPHGVNIALVYFSLVFLFLWRYWLMQRELLFLTLSLSMEILINAARDMFPQYFGVWICTVSCNGKPWIWNCMKNEHISILCVTLLLHKTVSSFQYIEMKHVNVIRLDSCCVGYVKDYDENAVNRNFKYAVSQSGLFVWTDYTSDKASCDLRSSATQPIKLRLPCTFICIGITFGIWRVHTLLELKLFHLRKPWRSDHLALH